MSASDDSASIKNAASLLVKGGTLTGEPCEKCGGVMIRFGGKTTCISCGSAKEQEDAGTRHEPEPLREQTASSSSDLGSAAGIIEQKITRLASEIGDENDLMLQKQKADLLE